jgi:uncharacterized repeat protein (TIGR04076 family)
MPQEESVKCKITVLKRTIHQDLYEQYRGKPGNLCEVFTEGQEFIIDSPPFAVPEGFCQWAWADIRPFLHGIYGGIRYGGADVFVTCCTDGFRPVLFKVERISE